MYTDQNFTRMQIGYQKKRDEATLERRINMQEMLVELLYLCPMLAFAELFPDILWLDGPLIADRNSRS